METFLLFFGLFACLFFFAVSVTSFLEKEFRAAIISMGGGVIIPLPFILPAFFGFQYPSWLEILLLAVSIIPICIFLIPVRFPGKEPLQVPGSRFDERDTMFSRRDLVPGSDLFREYYEKFPERKILDNKFRRLPGLLKSGSRYFDPILFAATESVFNKVEELQHRVDGPVAVNAVEVSPEDITNRIKKMALKWGVHSVGITELKDYHVYRVGGRQKRYGKVLEPEHKFALALTVEMDYDMMKWAPAAPAVLESARQYLNSGMIAIQLAEFIRELGYSARAHIDANYHVICPLVARDAGLGEIGRMGLLMTPGLGPRVRIAVVTTDLPLIPENPTHLMGGSDPGMIDFCSRCKKCAAVCPSSAIPTGPREEIDGSLRWKTSSESCYTFCCLAGTDCGRCMIVCPFSHPDNWFHRLIRLGIRNSLLFSRLALPLDDLFYGEKPKPRATVP